MAFSSDHPREVDAAVGRLAGDNEPDTAGILVWAYVAGRQLDVWLSEALADSGLSTSDYGALAGVALADDRLMTAGDLARWVVQTSGGTAKTLQRLVDRGLVRRVADPDDGRRTAFHLTREGHRALEDADAAVAACLTELGSHLDADEAEAAVRGLEVADKAIRRHREAGVR